MKVHTWYSARLASPVAKLPSVATASTRQAAASMNPASFVASSITSHAVGSGKNVQHNER